MRSWHAVSIHAPRAGGNDNAAGSRPPEEGFNTCPPRGGQQNPFHLLRRVLIVSIHAPRAGGNISLSCLFLQSPIVSIHAPRAGGNPPDVLDRISDTVSIHAPRAGGNTHQVFVLTTMQSFNTCPPRGGQPSSQIGCATSSEFQYMPPARGATYFHVSSSLNCCRFNTCPP